MKNNRLHHKSSLVRSSIIVVLLLALFSIMSLNVFAHPQGTQSTRVPSGGNAPSGMADMHWNPQTKELKVTLHVNGLSPNSNHAAHIHTGSCSKEGHILYPFRNIIADASGNGVVTTTVNNVADGIPASGWDITVHNGATAGTGTLLCGNIVNPNKATSVSVPVRV